MNEVKEFDFHDLVTDVTKKLPQGEQPTIAEIVKQVFGSLTDATVVYKRVEIHGFGSFYISTTAPRHGVDPQGHEYNKPAGKKMKFRAAKRVKDILKDLQ